MFTNLFQNGKSDRLRLNLGISILAILGGSALGLLGLRILGGLVVGIGIGWGLYGWWVQRTLIRPLEQLISLRGASLVQDSLAFTDALVALGQGDLTAKIKLASQPVLQSGPPELSHLNGILNQILSSLQGSANEFNVVTNEPCQRLFYVGADAYIEGRTCGEILAQTLGGRGNVVVLAGFFSQASQELRRKGFESMLREKYPSIRILARLETLAKVDTAYTLTKDLLSGSPIPDGIYINDGGIPASIARAVVDAGMAGKVKLVCHDLVDETMEFVAKGVITATLGQDPYAQGHDTVMHLFNHLVTGWRPSTPRLLTARDIVTQENYTKFWNARQGLIESQSAQEQRAKPLQPSPRPLRIAVVGREESDFWMPVKAGVLAAAQSLREYNAHVDWIVPEPDKTPDIDVRGPLLEKLVEQGYQAIALDIPHQRLVPYVNRLAARGVPVATFNGEPNSLRGLISMLENRAKVLLTVSHDLTDSARYLGGLDLHSPVENLRENSPVDDSIVQSFSAAVREVAQDAREQAQASSLVTTAVDQIVRTIDKVACQVSEVSSAASLSALTAEDGTGTVNQTLHQMENIANAVGVTAKTILEMSTYSQQIETILFTLREFTHQTNLLALNASIVAAGASEAGNGFNVVAREMRELAKKSSQGTKEVEAIVQTVKQSIFLAIESIRTAINLVEEGSESAATSGEAMKQLLDSAVAMQQQTIPLVDANESVRNATIQLREANSRVSRVITENLAATQQISTATDELVSRARAVSRSALSVAEIAQELEGATAVFHIE